MNFYWVLNGQRMKRFLLVTLAALFTAGIIYTEKDSMSVFTKMTAASGDQPEAIYNVETKEKRLSLTFDISWGSERPGPILDVLEKKGVTKATFFLSAPWAEHHPEIVQRIKDLGFEIASHGHKHINYSRLKDDEIREQILKADKTLKSLTGTTPTLIRPPNGDFDKRVLRIAEELGYKVVKWDTDSKDWINPGVEKIVQNVVTKAHPGDIILLHASDSSKQTHEALPKIIDDLKGKGYEFVTVSELIAGVKSNVKQLD